MKSINGEEENIEIVKTLAIYSVLSENHGSRTLLAWSLGCEFVKNVIFKRCL